MYGNSPMDLKISLLWGVMEAPHSNWEIGRGGKRREGVICYFVLKNKKTPLRDSNPTDSPLNTEYGNGEYSYGNGEYSYGE